MQLSLGGNRVTVTAADLVIGSDASAALVVAGHGVLPRHAVVRLRPDGRAVVTPGVAGAFLLVNGARVGSTPQVLEPGDRLVIGDQEIIALDSAAAAGAAQRLNVTMMGMPAATHGARTTPPGPLSAMPTAPPARSLRTPLLIASILVAIVFGYLLLIKG